MIHSSLIQPTSIAVFGASNKPQKPGTGLIKNLLNGFKGSIYPVNPREKEIQGLTVYHTKEELPPTDLAILAVPATACMEVIQFMTAERDTRAFIIISAGFSEYGEAGHALEKQLVNFATYHQVTILGPNCIGLTNACYTGLFTTPAPRTHRSGVDFVSASGALAVFIFEQARLHGLLFNEAITVGNSARIGVEDVLEHWDTNATKNNGGRVKLVYLEQVKNPHKLYRHLHALVKKGYEVVVCMAGETDAAVRASLSHTGALSSDVTTLKLLIQKAGAIVCSSRYEMVHLACILQIAPTIGNKAGIVTHAGGPGVLLAESLQHNSFKIPEISKTTQTTLKTLLHPGSAVGNPIDILATGTREQLKQVLMVCDHEPDIDFTIVIYGRTGLEDLFETYQLLSDTISQLQKPVFVVTPSVAEATDEVAFYVAQQNMVFFDEVLLAHNLHKVRSKKQSAITEIPKLGVKETNTYKLLTHKESMQRIAHLPVSIPHQWVIASNDDLHVITGFETPKAAKALGLLHKTERGGVKLNIMGQEMLEEAWKSLSGIKECTGMLVQDMVEGLELFIGAKHLPGLGYTVHVGLGGVLIELIMDTVSQLAPLDVGDALHLLSGLRGQKLFDGYRNFPAVNRLALAELLERFSQFLVENDDIKEMDINPLIAQGNAFYAVDVRIVTY